MIAASATYLGSALDAEAWASHLLGTFHQQRHELPFPQAVEVDPALLFGEPLVTRLATFDDPGARVALVSIAAVDGGNLGALAAQLLASSTPVVGAPRSIEQIGESKVIGAALMREQVFDDARTVLLESRHPDGETMAVGVLIDRNLGGWPRTSCWPSRSSRSRARWPATRRAMRPSWSWNRSSRASPPG